MGGGENSQTSSSEPWGPAQGNLRLGLRRAEGLYSRGVGADVYSGPRVAGMDRYTGSGLSTLASAAKANRNGAGLSGQAQGVIDAGGYNPAMQAALKNTQDLASSSYSISPEVQQALDYQTNRALGATNAATSAAGRYGSAAQADAMSRAIGNVNNDVLVSDIRNWQGRRDAANSNLFNMGQQGFSNLGGAYNMLLQPGQTMQGIGAAREGYRQNQLNARMAEFDERQNRPWEQLSRYNAISSGAGGLGGTQTQSGGGQSGMMNMLGYGLTGAGLLGGFM